MKNQTFASTGKIEIRGRGANLNSAGRFERLSAEFDEEPNPDEEFTGQIKTELYKDTAKSVISFNDSPDVGLTATLNIYRGCEHGCIYCYARPTHEYLGLSAGIDFESKIFVKMDAPEILRKTLMAKSWKPQVVGLSGVTDCYQPSERKLQLTRKCLEVFAEFLNPIVIITKNYLVTRDIDILQKLAEHSAAKVVVSMTSLDPKLARAMEPRASRPELKLKAISELTKAGIPVSVNMAPIIPGLTDSEIPKLLAAAANAGAETAGYTMLRLPYGVKDLFESWLDEHYPLRKNKVLNRIRDVRGGKKLYDAKFGSRMTGEGTYAEHIETMFSAYSKKFGLDKKRSRLSAAAFRKPGSQLSFL